MTVERSQQLGRVIMTMAVLQTILFLVGTLRRSYATLAIPVALGVSAVSALAFWIGYTLATNEGSEWDDADFGDEDAPAPV